MKPPADHGEKSGNNRAVEGLDVSNSEIDEFTEEDDPSTANGGALPMKSACNSYQFSEREVPNPNNSVSTSNLLTGKDEKPLEPPHHQTCQRSESEEATKKGVSKFKLFLTFGSTIFYVIFTVMRFYDTIIYQPIENFLSYSLTSVIYVLSATVTTCFSLNMNKLKSEKERQGLLNFQNLGVLIGGFFFIEIFHIFFRLIFGKKIYDVGAVSLIIFKNISITISLFIGFHLLTLEIYTLMSFYAFKYLKSHNREERQYYYNLLTETQADVGLLGILDGSFRTVPLQMLQITIFLKSKYSLENFLHFQEASQLLSFLFIAWCSTSYQSSLRVHLPNKQDMNIRSMIWYYIWNFFYCFSRTLCVGACATFWPLTTIVLALVHCAGWGFWLWWNHAPLYFCRNNKYWHVLFCAVIGVVYFTFPINLDEKPTKKRYCIFYGLMLFENFLGIIVWYFNEQEPPWYYLGLFIAIASSIFGVIFQLIYYKRCHPNKIYLKDIKVRVPHN